MLTYSHKIVRGILRFQLLQGYSQVKYRIVCLINFTSDSVSLPV